MLAHVAFVLVPSLTCSNFGPHRDRWIKKRPLQMEWIEDVPLSELIELDT